MAEAPPLEPASLPTSHDPLPFDILLDLAGHGPVPEPQLCRSCGRPTTLPKLLDCLHSVCEGCNAARPFLMDCPTCHIPSRTKNRIPDYVAEHFLAVSDRGRTAHVCAVHEDAEGAVPEPATFYCGTCSVFLCSACSAEHRQHTSFHSHVTVLLEDLTPEMVRVPVTCPSHGKDQLISGFCTICRVGVCPTCMTGAHHTHPIVTAGLDTSVYAEACRTLDEELVRPVLPSMLDAVATTLRTIDELLAAGTANVKTQHAVIDEWTRDGLAARQERAEVLRGEVVAKWDACCKALTSQRRDVARRVHAFAQARNYATALCRIGAPREVLMASPFVKRRLSALRSWLRPIEPCVSRDPITVTLDARRVEGGDVTTHGHVSEPSMRPWQQGRPPGTWGDRECIFVVGGISSDREVSSTVERYHVSQSPGEEASVEAAEAMPTARSGLACAVLDNWLYAVGGWARDRDRTSMMDFRSVVEGFDPASRTWDRTRAAMGMARINHVCVTLGDYIYALGGVDDDTGLSPVERYDAQTNSWEARASMVKSRGYRACAVLAAHIYATGGWSTDLGHLNTVQRYDPMQNTWEPVRDMPVGRDHHAAVVLDDLLYVIGCRSSEEGASSRVDRFDSTRNEWDPVAPLAVGRWALAAVTAGERIYAIGGMKDYYSAVTDVEAYDAVSNTWMPCKPMATSRRNVTAGVLAIDDA